MSVPFGKTFYPKESRKVKVSFQKLRTKLLRICSSVTRELFQGEPVKNLDKVCLKKGYLIGDFFGISGKHEVDKFIFHALK